MAKESIKDIQDEFIKEKNNSKSSNEEKRITSVNLTNGALKLLRLHKAYTGENISDFVENVVREKLEGKYDLKKGK